MSKHTPGPWQLRGTPNDLDFTHDISGIASIYRTDDSLSNARLIAAAPELLEALDNISSLTEEKRLAIIAKAKGE